MFTVALKVNNLSHAICPTDMIKSEKIRAMLSYFLAWYPGVIYKQSSLRVTQTRVLSLCQIPSHSAPGKIL